MVRDPGGPEGLEGAGQRARWPLALEGQPGELGIIVEPLRVPHEPFPFWMVAFGSRGVLKCRESDLQVIK